jgi:hypothetical protein
MHSSHQNKGNFHTVLHETTTCATISDELKVIISINRLNIFMIFRWLFAHATQVLERQSYW